MTSNAKANPPPGANTLVPESFLDVPTQRLYALSIGALCQAIKVFDFLRYLVLPDVANGGYVKKWLTADFLFCFCLAQLRIPRLRYSKSVVALQILSLWFLNGLMFGGITVNVGGTRSWTVVPSLGLANRANIASTPPGSGLWDMLPRFGLGSLTSSSGGKDAHLLGQHTVRMSPISTAHLNPHGQTFCLASSGHSVLIPLLLNNTTPAGVRHSLVPLGYVEGSGAKIERVDLSAKDLKAIENARLEDLQVARDAASKRDNDEYDEYDDEEDDQSDAESPFKLQKTQSVTYIRVSKPGTLRLDRVLDTSNADARLVYPGEVTIVPCPRAEFVPDDIPDMRCATPGITSGAGEELNLQIDVYGVPPLSLRWYKEVDGRRESFMVEGIESSGHAHRRTGDEPRALERTPTRRPAAELRIPLTVSLDALGTHSYVLETVMDALGNVVHAGSSTPPSDSSASGALHKLGITPSYNVSASRTRRSVSVLRRPSVLFEACGPGTPVSLLIGSDAPLVVSAKNADSLDGPWDVGVHYQPSEVEDSAKKSTKRLKPWTKDVQMPQGRRDMTFRASEPGEYTLVGVKGRYCEGDILSPDTCKVVERPYPTAEIKWKKIHECSGDTGVSASLVLHGTPPFQVYYRMQRDKEPPREISKSFTSSRGELTIQPERSGHYTFTFLYLSDANYKKVNLNGPSIDQVVHPPAHAEFSQREPVGRGKRKISSCSGSTVDVDVDLRGTGPWTLEAQIVGLKGSEIVRVPNISKSRYTLNLPIPKDVDRDGGSFEIDLVSVEDSYGCKRSLSVPGIAVNVRRVKPTARFYGKVDDRHITTLDNEQASLPLRLTGDGPWRVKYRHVDRPDRPLSATVSSPNGELHVSDKGVYELVEISDSQCPGSVVSGDSTYRVDHVPRPSAKLSPEIQSIYEPYNGSHILPPICEGAHDHVDLDLTGRPPFQIMYNVARDNDAGGTKILDQPTFSSIQPRTSFQLHTSEAARIYYEVKQVGDVAYPLAKNKNAVIPRSERLLFEQQVLVRPSARFRNLNRLAYCLNDVLRPQDPSSLDGIIILEGTPPFKLHLAIRNVATSNIYREALMVDEKMWRLNVPNYTFNSVGPHLVIIESVQDASHCEQAVPDPLYRSVYVDIAETAAIVPFDRREDFCVGDVTQFQLEGIPPWTIGYRINGKSYTQEAKISPFSIAQQQPGEFTLTSIAHQQKMCKTAVTDLRYTVHPLPAARVGHGRRIVQDIHEGDQAEIIFNLIGEPPFTFTYQRAELTTKKGQQGKVLETHTVSGVTTKEYSIFSALEGTWTVTFIADRYCRYPPSQPDGVDKSR
ncbi:uncharacterized protein C8Q71DRAFT_100734 [Rhodofomes roseus]|uniref:Ig-like domain-containing protein n=1 Tax=Rhodofomes roseus TaxID=34475 RepID=A0ABQ8KDZ7_9APHY|nr:uncharacterized protein C8Q71DRAFT_100734 [Rhodofomes roseus]KAH9835872.1 hypothetical protein C8Q71DRAFT_100734 [Rhodofomes roseus]